MLKARAQNGDVIIGLSREDIDQLIAYQPIVIPPGEMNLRHATMIMFGETEIGIAADLMTQGVILRARRLSSADGETP